MNTWIFVGAGLLVLGAVTHGQAPDTGGSQPAIFCRADALRPAERTRQAELRSAVEAAVIDVAERPDGYALRLDPSTAVFVAAAEWITLEARCCPFLRLGLERGDATWLVLAGGEGVKEFLTLELAPLLR